MHTRYTRSVFVERKLSSDILNKILKEWISIFGIPKSILTDNGGEFTSDEMREVTSLLNITKYTTGADAPWQNGLCEKVHQITDMILLKLSATYPNIELDILLAWANMARNSLQMYLGFSSHQLVFGVNPNLPNVLGDRLPAMNETINSDVFRKHLNALKASREAFVKSDADTRIKRALKRKLTCAQMVFRTGDLVYYKKDSSERWLGPAKVMFQDGKVVFIRHGSMFYRVSINRLNPANDNSGEVIGEETLNEEKIEERPNLEGSIIDHILDDSLLAPNIEKVYPCGICKIEVSDDDKALQCDRCKKWCHIKCAKVDEQIYNNLLITGQKFKWNCPNHRRNHKKLEAGNYINEVFVNYVPRGKLEDENCRLAKQEELNKLKEYDVYEIVDKKDHNCISTRWIMTYKGEKIKGRLVARGFEEEALFQKDSPTVSKSGINFIMMITCLKGWIIKTTDIRSAFLQGKMLERDVYIKPPVEAKIEDGKIWKLKKCLYGLSDASRQFYMSVREVLLQIGCKQSICDHSFFYFEREGTLEGVVVSHIDDFLHAGSEVFDLIVIKSLVESFSAGKEEIKSFSYVGLQIKQELNGIYVHQIQYIDAIEIKKLDKVEGIDIGRSLTVDELTDYRSMLGSLNWCVRTTRPDLGFSLIDLSTKFRDANVFDFLRLIKVIRKLKSDKVVIYFPILSNQVDMVLLVYSDAAFHNLSDKVGSTMAYIILCRVGDNVSPLAWKTNKIKRIVTSSIGAETLSLSRALGDAIFYQHFFHEILKIKPKIHAFVDNKGLAEAAHSSTQMEELRLNLDIAEIREVISSGQVESVTWVPGSEMLADCMTKQKSSFSTINLINILETGVLKFKH